jgi:hypothetical protein
MDKVTSQCERSVNMEGFLNDAGLIFLGADFVPMESRV